jgi:hypothetical protein
MPTLIVDAVTASATADITAVLTPADAATSSVATAVSAAPRAVESPAPPAGPPFVAGLSPWSVPGDWWRLGSGAPIPGHPLAATWSGQRTLGAAAAASGTSADAGKPHGPPQASPEHRPQLPDRVPFAPVSSASAAAVGGGGASGSGLPVLLVLPFVAALLDLARRVALEHATWPSGHRRRVPDRPG